MVRMAFSNHRCKILTVSQLLSKEDVDEILYLSEDFIPQSEVKQISSGLDLCTLIKHNELIGNCPSLAMSGHSTCQMAPSLGCHVRRWRGMDMKLAKV